MQTLRRSCWVKIVFALCVVAQCVMLFPHHHHCGGNAPCFYTRHCTEGEHHNHHADAHSPHTDCCDHSERHGEAACDHKPEFIAQSRQHLVPDIADAGFTINTWCETARVNIVRADDSPTRRPVGEIPILHNIGIEYLATAYPSHADGAHRV